MARDTAIGNAGAMETGRSTRILRWLFGAVLLMRLLFPFFNSPLGHLFSDPQRHWDNGASFLHPNLMGGQDPFLYQVWMFALQHAGAANSAVILLGTGLLCAAMPLGWTGALKELLPERWALSGGIVMGLIPAFTGIYAYFMNETLLLTLTGFAVWCSLRAMRLRTTAAFALACALWLLAGFTRSVALPMALVSLLAIWLPQPGKIPKAAIGIVLLAALAIPAGLHARMALHYFAPFGNIYLNDIYRSSGRKDIAIDFHAQGQYRFGSPTFYNPTFYPFSGWTTDRDGVVSIRIDPAKGRADWRAETVRAAREDTFPLWKDMTENFVHLCFAQAWPDNDRDTLTGWLTVWTRWLWPVLVLVVVYGAARRRFVGREWLLPALGLGMFAFLALQRDGVMEGRFRKPIDPLFVAAATVMAWRWRVSRLAPVPA